MTGQTLKARGLFFYYFIIRNLLNSPSYAQFQDEFLKVQTLKCKTELKEAIKKKFAYCLPAWLCSGFFTNTKIIICTRKKFYFKLGRTSIDLQAYRTKFNVIFLFNMNFHFRYRKKIRITTGLVFVIRIQMMAKNDLLKPLIINNNYWQKTINRNEKTRIFAMLI